MLDPRFDTIREKGGPRYAAFLAAGFREHYQSGPRTTPFLLQKRIIRTSDDATLFFVNVWVFIRDSAWCHIGPLAYEAEGQFDTVDTRRTFNVMLFCEDAKPAEIEAFFQRIFDAMGCRSYSE
ncbi:MAG: hypothetical protein KGL39_42935 [Patescibacteria group bacterium]|nr:hypothetical protein [Patescibacteria group bacterium]